MGYIENYLLDPKVWNANLTDEDFWGVITETKNNNLGFHSFMIKIIDKDKVMIKATPKGGLTTRKRTMSNDGKGNMDMKKVYEGGSDKGDGKGPNKGAGSGGGTADGKGRSGGQSGGWVVPTGMNPWGPPQAVGGAAGGQKGGVADPGPPPQMERHWTPTSDWDVGQ